MLIKKPDGIDLNTLNSTVLLCLIHLGLANRLVFSFLMI